MCYTDIMSDLKRLMGKREELGQLLSSLSSLGRAHLFQTVAAIPAESRKEYRAAFLTGLHNGVISQDEFDWLNSVCEQPDAEIEMMDRIFLARISAELIGINRVKLEGMVSPSSFVH